MDTTIGAASAAGGERLVYSVAEAGALLGISRAFAYELVARGELPVIRLGRRRLVPKVALNALAGAEPTSQTAAEGSIAAGMMSTRVSTEMSTPQVRASQGRGVRVRALRCQSSQGRRSRGARHVGRRTLTARS